MTNTNNIKDLTPIEVMKYIRELEVETGTPAMAEDKLNGYTLPQIEELAAELEKERGFQEMAKQS